MRTFIALELPERFAGEVSQLSRVLSYEIEARFGERGSHNIVLAFLGDINDGQIMPVIAAMNAAAGFAHPVPLSPSRLGKFGKKSDATLWLGIENTISISMPVVASMLSRSWMCWDVRTISSRWVCFCGVRFLLMSRTWKT